MRARALENHSPTPESIVRTLVAALNRGDIAGVLDLCAGDIELWSPGPELAGQALHGKDELRQMLEESESRWPDSWLAIRSLIADGEQVAAEMTTVVSSNNRPVSQPFAVFYTVRDGLVVRQASYFDLRALEDALEG